MEREKIVHPFFHNKISINVFLYNMLENREDYKMKNMGEFDLIDKITKDCLIRPDNVIKAIGDDAAAFRADSGKIILITTDLLIERVHFLPDSISGFELGQKALAVNLSDIAAMGGIAGHAFVSIAIPDNYEADYIKDIYEGIKTIAGKFGVNILGGDTTGSKSDLVINIALTGTASEDAILFRSGAKKGDKICSTGFLGDSKAGLYLILNKIPTDSKEWKALRDAHILPRPYLEEGRFLAKQKGVHAGIDLSDGLSSDLGHIIKQSQKGAKIYGENIPVSDNLKKFCGYFNQNPLEFALSGGEDYTLLVTIDKNMAVSVARAYKEKFDKPLFFMGEITDSGKMELMDVNGISQIIAPSGWDHFCNK